MPYLVFHRGAYWFQIRVPQALTARYGRLIRQNLQTADPSVAKPLALQLGGQWLQRFTLERQGIVEPEQISAPFLPAPVEPLPQPAVQRPENREGYEDSVAGLVRYWRRLNPDRSVSTFREVEAVARQFQRKIRKRPSELQRTDIAAWRDHLIAKRLKRATVAKKVGFVSTLLQTAYDAGFLPQNVARGMKIPKPKVADAGRRGFSEDELRRIFSSPVYSKKQRPRAGGGEAAAWLPILALTTGARLEELCQLRVEDVWEHTEHGPLIRISDSHREQRIKTTGSRREIPIHPDVIAIGLMAYRHDIDDMGYEWLFPGLEPDHDGRRGGTWGQWFSRYLRSRAGCFVLDPNVVFHSFRHTFKSLCRSANVPEEVHDALTGHVGSTVGRRYGEVPLESKVGAIRRLRFPVSLPRVYE